MLSWSNEEESAQITRMEEMHYRCLLPVAAKKRRNRPPNSCNGRHPGITLTAGISEEDVYFLDITILRISKLLKLFSTHSSLPVTAEGFIKREALRLH